MNPPCPGDADVASDKSDSIGDAGIFIGCRWNPPQKKMLLETRSRARRSSAAPRPFKTACRRAKSWQLGPRSLLFRKPLYIRNTLSEKRFSGSRHRASTPPKPLVKKTPCRARKATTCAKRRHLVSDLRRFSSVDRAIPIQRCGLPPAHPFNPPIDRKKGRRLGHPFQSNQSNLLFFQVKVARREGAPIPARPLLFYWGHNQCAVFSVCRRPIPCYHTGTADSISGFF